MMKNRIVASLDNVKMPAVRKDIVLNSLLKKADVQRDSQERYLFMKRKKNGIIFVSIAAVAVIAVAVIIIYPLMTNNYQEVSQNPEGAQGDALKTTMTDDMPAGGSVEFGEETIPLTNLEIKTEYDEPSHLYIAKQSSIQFTEEDKDTVIKSLEENEWENVSGRITGIQSDTQFILNFSQPETYDYSVHGEKDEVPNFSATEEHVEFSKQFLTDSGIAELLKKYDVELAEQPKIEHTTLFYGQYEGFRTETYLRLHFSPDGTLEDAQLYAVSFEDAVVTENVLPLEEAVKDAFYCSECTGLGDDKYSIIGVEVVYKSGLPFYELELNNEQNGMTMSGYALAVDYSELESNEELKKAFDNLMEEGIW